MLQTTAVTHNVTLKYVGCSLNYVF